MEITNASVPDSLDIYIFVWSSFTTSKIALTGCLHLPSREMVSNIADEILATLLEH